MTLRTFTHVLIAAIIVSISLMLASHNLTAQTTPRIQIEPLKLKLEPYVASKLSPEDKDLFETLLNCYIESVWMYIYEKGYHNCFINELQPIIPDKKIVGRARTMRYLPERPDVKAKIKGMQLNYVSATDTKPGEILVFDAGGDIRSAVTGDITTSLFAYNGGVGIICDGSLRDIPPIKKMGIQVFERAGQAAASIGIMSIDYQVPVKICNATVIPGDIILGDAHGILVIPKELAREVADKAKEFDMWENFLKTLILSGETVYDTETPDGRLKEKYQEYKRKLMKK